MGEIGCTVFLVFTVILVFTNFPILNAIDGYRAAKAVILIRSFSDAVNSITALDSSHASHAIGNSDVAASAYISYVTSCGFASPTANTGSAYATSSGDGSATDSDVAATSFIVGTDTRSVCATRSINNTTLYFNVATGSISHIIIITSTNGRTTISTLSSQRACALNGDLAIVTNPDGRKCMISRRTSASSTGQRIRRSVGQDDGSVTIAKNTPCCITDFHISKCHCGGDVLVDLDLVTCRFTITRDEPVTIFINIYLPIVDDRFVGFCPRPLCDRAQQGKNK